MSYKKQQGAAIIVALFITALIAVAAVAMVEHFRIDVRRTQLILQANQSYYYAQGSLAWSINELTTRLQKQQSQPNDKTNPIIAPIGKEGPYTINSSIIDLQGLLNINNLSNPGYQAVFMRLLQNTTRLDPIKAQAIVTAIVDWITVGLKNTSFDQYYLTLSPAYRSAHRPMVSISELRLVKGITPELLTILLPYLTALPTSTLVNVNTASTPVLISLGLNQNPPTNNDKTTKISNYFLLKTNVTVADQQTIFYALLHRDSNAQTKAGTVSIIWQSKGTV